MTTDPLVAELVEIRKRRSLSQVDVAQRMGITPGRVGHIESGYRTPNLAALRKYCAAIGAQLTALDSTQECSPRLGPVLTGGAVVSRGATSTRRPPRLA